MLDFLPSEELCSSLDSFIHKMKNKWSEELKRTEKHQPNEIRDIHSIGVVQLGPEKRFGLFKEKKDLFL